MITQVCVIGSGAWACTAAKMVSTNCCEGGQAGIFAQEVKMWVYEEVVDGRKLTDIINEQHENVKYLEGEWASGEKLNGFGLTSEAT